MNNFAGKPVKSQGKQEKSKNKYQQIFGRQLSLEMYQKILKLYSDPKIILKALEIAEENGDKPSYLLKILSDWQKNGLTSIRSIKTYLENRQAQKGNKRKYISHSNNSSNDNCHNKISMEKLYKKGYK